MQHIIFQAHVSSKSVEIIHWCEYYQFFHNLVFNRCVRNVKKIKETNLSYFFKSEKPAALAHAMGSARFTVGSARFTVGRGAHKHSLMSLKVGKALTLLHHAGVSFVLRWQKPG